MEAQMDVRRQLFGVGFQIVYSDASNVYILFWICSTVQYNTYVYWGR